MEQKREEGNKDFKKGESWVKGGCLKKAAVGQEAPYELCTCTENVFESAAISQNGFSKSKIPVDESQ